MTVKKYRIATTKGQVLPIAGTLVVCFPCRDGLAIAADDRSTLRPGLFVDGQKKFVEFGSL